MKYHFLLISENYQLLNTSMQGLQYSQAEERLSQYGKNELTERKKTSVLILLLHQFKDIMIIILLLFTLILCKPILGQDIWFSASTFVVKSATFAKPETAVGKAIAESRI